MPKVADIDIGRTGTAEKAFGRLTIAITFPCLYNGRKRSVIIMFCPNCGNDCGEATQCSACGLDLGGIEYSIQHHRNEGNKHDLGSDAISFKDVASNTNRIISVTGIYKCLSGYLELSQDAVTVFREYPFRPVTKVTIPFQNIRFVTYLQTTEKQNCGFLSIYTWESKAPLVTSCDQAEHDSMSVLYNWRFDKNVFLLLFQFLSAHARYNRSNWLRMRKKAINPEIIEAAQSKYGLKYYKQFYPNKQVAIRAMQTDNGLSEDDASIVINYVFDVFNNEIYESFEKSLRLHEKTNCPNCRSSRIASKERGVDHFSARSMFAVSPGLGMYYASKDARKEQYVCMNCGYVWYQK